jgi:cytochrome c oxidase assembly protein subunit 15
MQQTKPLAGTQARSRALNPIRAWLFTVAALICVMVGIGGATRLTGSGLSITEWQPIIGIVPPLSDAAWHEAFEKYRQVPQYEHVNKGMSLAAFKRIYWWEWTHRFLGRLIGIVFLVPFSYFLAIGRIDRSLAAKLGAIFLLGSLQGAVGWYMVRSGLAGRIDVSQYRLALHLSLAMLILGATLWLALSTRDQPARDPVQPLPGFATAGLLLGIVFLQVVAGAFVAGLRAGAGYNTWPLMDGRLIPEGLGAIYPRWANLFENAVTVQFNHRVLAYVLFLATLWQTRKVLANCREPRARASTIGLLGAVTGQIALGIWTLLAQAPLVLALAHQAGAVAVFAIAVWHLHALSAGRNASRERTDLPMRPIPPRASV